MGLTYYNLIENDQYNREIKHNLYRENSSIFSYYILKSLLLFNFQSFLQLCKFNNLNLLNFKKANISLNNLCKFYKKIYKSELFLEYLDKINLIYQNLKMNYNHKDNFILSNLRMSICEMG